MLTAQVMQKSPGFFMFSPYNRPFRYGNKMRWMVQDCLSQIKECFMCWRSKFVEDFEIFFNLCQFPLLIVKCRRGIFKTTYLLQNIAWSDPFSFESKEFLGSLWTAWRRIPGRQSPSCRKNRRTEARFNSWAGFYLLKWGKRRQEDVCLHYVDFVILSQEMDYHSLIALLISVSDNYMWTNIVLP